MPKSIETLRLSTIAGKDSGRKQTSTPVMTQSYYRHRFSFVGSTILLLLAQIHYIDNKIGVTNAFSNSPILPSPANSNYGRPHTTRYAIFRSSSEDLETSKQDNKKMILVLGGSGYIGRRICKELVDATEDGDSTKVVSISRNGKPPSWATSLGGNDSWSEKVEWIQHEIGSESEDGKPSLTETLESICEENTETTIVGCIGNVNPTPSWEGLWGLAYDNDLLFEENGKVYEAFLNQTESLRTKGLLSVDRCVLLSLDYTCQKCLEGPIDGYLNGKRLAERKLLEAVTQQNGGSLKDPSNLEKVVVVGLPNFVYGGKRFPTFGKIYRKIVESPIAKAYVGGNQAIRSLSAANPEDWVEAMVRLNVCVVILIEVFMSHGGFLSLFFEIFFNDINA